MTCRRFQIGACTPTELQNLHLVIDHNAGRDEAVCKRPVHFTVHRDFRCQHSLGSAGLRFANTVIKSGKVGNQRRRGLLLLINLVFLVDQSEVIGECPQALGAPQHQITIRLERVVQSGNDAFLQDRAEIDQ